MERALLRTLFAWKNQLSIFSQLPGGLVRCRRPSGEGALKKQRTLQKLCCTFWTLTAGLVRSVAWLRPNAEIALMAGIQAFQATRSVP